MSILGKNIAHQYILRAAMYVFPFITLPYLTRILGPEAFAVRAYVLSTMTFVSTFLNFGFDAYGTREVALARKCHDSINIMISRITLLRLVFCVVGIVPIIFLIRMVPILADNTVYTLIAYFGVCVRALLPDFVFQGLEDMGILTRRYLVSQSVAVMLIFLLVKSPSELVILPIIEFVAALVALAWSWENVFVARGFSFRMRSFSGVAVVLRESWILFLSSIATTAFSALTTIMIGVYIKDANLISYWSLAVSVVSAVQGLYTPLNNSLYPHMCARGEFAIVKKFLIIGTPLSLFFSIAIAVCAEPIMFVLGGSDYLDGSYVLVLLSPVAFISFPAMLLGFPVLGAVGQTRMLTASSVISAAFHIVGLFVLIAVGGFQIVSLAVLRCLTEAVLCASRAAFVLVCRRAGALA